MLYELSLPQGLDLNNQIDRSRSATRVTISAATLNSQELLELNARAEAWLKDNAPQVAGVNSTGPAALFAYIGQRNIRAMLVGTVVVLLAISAILIFALRSLRLGLISIVPNLTPAVLGFGVWGLTVGQVGLSLSVVVAMTVGIVVDDTVHFLSEYGRARREHGRGPEEAVRYAYDTAGRAMFTTTVVLVAGFLIFAFSPFVPTAQVGVLTGMIIAFALIAGAVDGVGPEFRGAGCACGLICRRQGTCADVHCPRNRRKWSIGQGWTKGFERPQGASFSVLVLALACFCLPNAHASPRRNAGGQRPEDCA